MKCFAQLDRAFLNLYPHVGGPTKRRGRTDPTNAKPTRHFHIPPPVIKQNKV